MKIKIIKIDRVIDFIESTITQCEKAAEIEIGTEELNKINYERQLSKINILNEVEGSLRYYKTWGRFPEFEEIKND